MLFLEISGGSAERHKLEWSLINQIKIKIISFVTKTTVTKLTKYNKTSNSCLHAHSTHCLIKQHAYNTTILTPRSGLHQTLHVKLYSFGGSADAWWPTLWSAKCHEVPRLLCHVVPGCLRLQGRWALRHLLTADCTTCMPCLPRENRWCCCTRDRVIKQVVLLHKRE